MSRLPYLDPADASDDVRQAMAMLPPLNIFRTLAHAGTAFVPHLRLSASILGELDLDPVLRELAILQVAHQSEAQYEWVQHVAIGRHAGLTGNQIASVQAGDIDNRATLTDTERAVLAFTAEVVSGPTVSEPTFAAVNRQLSPREIVELLLTIGNYLMLARVMTTLEIEIDPAAGNQVVDTALANRTSQRATETERDA